MEHSYTKRHQLPVISIYSDKIAQYNVNVHKKIKEKACNMRTFAIIYSEMSSYMPPGKIRKMEGVMVC